MSVAERPVLTRDFIAHVGLELTAEGGLSTLSMRKLGAELGVEAMSLYHYVDNKSDLLAAMASQLYAKIELPPLDNGLGWEGAVRSVLGSYHDVLISHPGALELFLTQPSTSSGGLRVMTWTFELLTSVGLSGPDASAALHFAVAFVAGHVGTEFVQVRKQDAAIDLIAESEPGVGAFMKGMAEADPHDKFDAGLDLVIIGLRAQFDLP